MDVERDPQYRAEWVREWRVADLLSVRHELRQRVHVDARRVIEGAIEHLICRELSGQQERAAGIACTKIDWTDQLAAR